MIHRFPRFAVKTPCILLAATNDMNFVSLFLERKMSLKLSAYKHRIIKH